jgi:cyclic pyranopterin monophosphate synthase
VTSGFTHLDGRGNARMVDVTGKAPSHRRAEARCRVAVTSAGLRKLADTGGEQALETARIAGIRAAKRTADLIPLCHPLPLGDVAVDVSLADGHVAITATAETFERTGVEMEALTACALAALSVVGACGPGEAVVGDLTLWEKTGGRSGTWRNPAHPGTAGPASATAPATSRPTPGG